MELNVAQDAQQQEQQRVVRRKFATPPVKLACLSCRASRTRCDGGQPCASCVSKKNECLYRPSRRGGPRIRKKPLPDAGSQFASEMHVQEPETVLPAIPAQPLSVQNFIDPGAALGQLPDMPPNSDFIFDTLFPNDFPSSLFEGVSMPEPLLNGPVKTGPFVRTYRSDHSLLQAYYCWIHPYIPIFPPPETSPPVDQPYALSQSEPAALDEGLEPSSPVALALSAVLALLPCAEEQNPTFPEAVLFRRKYAQYYAQLALECIEAESELPDSATEPHKALESSPPPCERTPFHPRVPVELESIIALDLLSVYEYAQRGNIKKMKIRAGQALSTAMMEFSLHAQTDEDDYYSEARRRVWWLTYICATQSSIVSNTPPPLELYRTTFTTKYPTLDIDPEAWPVFIEAQQTILTATQFVIEMNKALAAQSDMEPVFHKMVELENRIRPLVEKSEAYTFTGCLAPPVDPAETCLVRSLRAMAKIKLNSARAKIHRYCSFYDLPVFVGKHCDLKSLGDAPPDAFELLPWPSCSCSSAGGSQTDSHSSSAKMGSSPESTSHQSISSSMSSPPTTSSTPQFTVSGQPELQKQHHQSQHRHQETWPAKAPFTSHASAKVCFRSALNIASGFDNLPYPNPAGLFGQDICFLSPSSPIVAPRMLPSFVCCAMQAAYVFLSIYRKTMALSLGVASRSYLVTMVLQLQQGLSSILVALENYGTAFEALRSMRDQIRLSAEPLFVAET